MSMQPPQLPDPVAHNERCMWVGLFAPWGLAVLLALILRACHFPFLGAIVVPSAAAIFIGALVKLGLRRSPRLDGPSDEWIVWMSRSAMLIGGGAVLFSV